MKNIVTFALVLGVVCLGTLGCKKGDGDNSGGKVKKLAIGQSVGVPLVEGNPEKVFTRFSVRFDRAMIASGRIRYSETLWLRELTPKAGGKLVLVIAEAKNVGPRRTRQGDWSFKMDVEIETTKGTIYPQTQQLQIRSPEGPPYSQDPRHQLEPGESWWLLCCGEIPADASPVAMLVKLGTWGGLDWTSPVEVRLDLRNLPQIETEQPLTKESLVGTYNRMDWREPDSIMLKSDGIYEHNYIMLRSKGKEQGSWEIQGQEIHFYPNGDRNRVIKGEIMEGKLYYGLNRMGPALVYEMLIEGVTAKTLDEAEAKHHVSAVAQAKAEEEKILQQIAGPKEDPSRESWAGTYIGRYKPSESEITLFKDGTYEYKSVMYPGRSTILDIQKGTWKIGTDGQNLRLFDGRDISSPTKGKIVGKTLFLGSGEIAFERQ